MKDKVVLGGSVMAAIAASLCCLGPIVAVVLGLGTFGAATAFEALRPYLIGLTALLLVGAFYLTYRKREVQCEEGACQIRGASRASKIMLWLATIAVVAFAAFPYYSGRLLKASTQKADANVAGVTDPSTATAAIAVGGMTCDACGISVKNALEKVPGVKSADVSYQQGRAVVVYDQTTTTPDALRSAIDATGYTAGEVAIGQTARSEARLTTALIDVEGMTCGSCATAIRLALSKVKGVNSAEVSFEKKEAKVTYDPALASSEQLKSAIERAGFKATKARLIEQ